MCLSTRAFTLPQQLKSFLRLIKKTFHFSLPVVLCLSMMSCESEKREIDSIKFVQIEYSDEEFNILKSTLDLPKRIYDYRVTPPPHTNALAIPINGHVATLGRVLFYDKKLSQNNTVSCASCHDQKLAFADDKAFSIGFNGELTLRNSFALGAVTNFISSYDTDSDFPSEEGSIFWDNRAHSIQDQSRQTLSDPIEMGMDLSRLGEKLEREEYYEVLFKHAFPGAPITTDLVLEALEEFINSLATSKSKFDRGMARKMDMSLPFDNFTEQENLGKSLYMINCSTCHGSDMITTDEPFANNGLDQVYQDKGIGARGDVPELYGAFKVPLLRNIELTAPYMHDGRFATLAEVIEHYDQGVQPHPVLHMNLREVDLTGQGESPRRLNLSDEERAAMIAFLKTLTDLDYTREVKWSDPFLK